ncbi:disulfide bond formation protein B [compost metagenome]
MFLARSRSLFLMGFLASLLIIGAVLYLEYEVGLQPCPLCWVQQFFLFGFGAICLMAFIHAPAQLGQYIYGGAAFSFALFGALAASRQVWLQSNGVVPEQTCHPTLAQMLQTLPLRQVVESLLFGTPDCVLVKWTLLGMSVAEWSLLAFSGMLVFSFLQFLCMRRRVF